MSDVIVDAQFLQDLLQSSFPGCSVEVEGSGGKYLVAITGDVFSGLNPVKRQQLVYQHLNAHISSGAVHAVTMRLKTPEESVTA